MTLALSELRRAADALRTLPVVCAVDVFEDDPRANQPVLEIVVGPRLERVPDNVVQTIGEHELGLRDVTSRPGGYYVVLAV